MSAVPVPKKTTAPQDASRHLEVVGASRRRHTLAYALVVIVVLGAAVFGTVTLNALAAAGAVEARALDARVAEAERSYAQLVADVAALEDPARIREAALELGLVPGGAGRHVQLQRNLPADGAVNELYTGERAADPLKPVLSLER
ncbi:hypothetical protein [Egicoccus halophilus]|uniref:Cell division protein FtsL n=1 Tax=Egicoccus halophilus TaxID=1670830 RepID=A0A8J3ACI3_9ACTN|nr:hypothetical protein [Egicoccus halophilus]GGI04313.1 hypothetical protein GCM10011354_08470 [Egicoccus halophilus]